MIVIAFFLPWVESCQALTGYDLATNQTGQVQSPGIYWLVPLVGIVCVVLFLFLGSDAIPSRVVSALIRLVAGVIGALPLYNLWLNVNRRHGALSFLYGWWIVVVGFVGVFLSSLLDFFAGLGSEG